jgi:hypothetical protein
MAKWMPTQIDFPMLDAATSIQRYANRSGGASFGLRGLARAIILPFTLNWQGKAGPSRALRERRVSPRIHPALIYVASEQCDRVAKMKLVEQLTLVTLQTAHHGSTSPRFGSPQRNHGSRPVSTDFLQQNRRKADIRIERPKGWERKEAHISTPVSAVR